MEEDPDKPERTEFNDDAIKQILKDALALQIQEKRKIPNKNLLNKAMTSSLTEFMACFKLVGYDVEGNPVSIAFHRTKMEQSALHNLFMEEIAKFMGGKNL